MGFTTLQTKGRTPMPRIYVADLSAYNAGKLHGVWIDAAGDLNDMLAQVDDMLARSPEPNVWRQRFKCPTSTCREYSIQVNGPNDARASVDCPECGQDAAPVEGSRGKPHPSAEEFAIHDHEGFEGWTPGEGTPLVDVARVAALIEEHGEVFGKLLANECGDIDRAESLMTEEYQGAHSSLADWAESFHDDMGTDLGTLSNYIDWERWARDAELGGDVFTIETDDGQTHVFWNR